MFMPEGITEVHVSVTFSWDLPEAERLVKAWSRVAPAKMGGPATGQRGGDFVPGMYLRDGYVITSRGCPNRCWFCSVPKREGRTIRELRVVQGWNILDDNLLACSEEHIRAVFAMLKSQKIQRAQFTGGLEAKRLKRWHVELLRDLKPKQIFFAYDTPDDWESLVEARKLFTQAEYGSRSILRCYVLCGFPGDTMHEAERRMRRVVDLGICPMAMLYRDQSGQTAREWRKFQKAWARPAAIFAKNKDMRYLEVA